MTLHGPWLYLLASTALVLLIALSVLLVRRRPPAPGKPDVSVGDPPAAPPVEVPPIEAPVEPPVEPPAPRPSRLAAGLAKTRGILGTRLGALARRDRLTDESYDEIEESLILADLGVGASARIVGALKSANLPAAEAMESLKKELIAVLRKSNPALVINHAAASVWLVTGVNGAGKTTSIAKLAHAQLALGRSVVLAAADTFRAAAIDQLGTWAMRLGVHMVRHEPGGDPGAVVYDAIAYAKARGIDLVIVDTAGRLHTKTNLMEELKKVRRIAEREAGQIAESLLVIDATVGQNGIAQARTFFEAIEITGVVLTKLDGTAKGGIVVAIQEELGIPVKAVGLGESLEDLELFDPDQFVEALLG